MAVPFKCLIGPDTTMKNDKKTKLVAIILLSPGMRVGMLSF
jgi:hypothetical protein